MNTELPVQEFRMCTRSAEETMRFGAALVRALPPAAFVALCGDLGAGKTTLVKGIAQELGIAARKVTSPTFVLMKEYRSKTRILVHADLYRLDSTVDVRLLGLDDYRAQTDLVVVEWAEKAAGLLPPERLTVELRHKTDTERECVVYGYGRRYLPVVSRLAAAVP